ncbi:hypothetical protein QBC40DRAFT_298815 [Triangularia verruculosa]|uniref:WSC domain-containing protein n=1 Tax=Triangularia verruculosa TaxID=2587418 RepID=A0AAN6XEQ8_9PEZI|nr:hypothetical protein QBC40DRAFT_298815 [Triangularia verruculosa]
MNDFESNLPIPNREKNHGNALPEVYICHHHGPTGAGQHPWRGKPDRTQDAEDDDNTIFRQDGRSLPPRPDSTAQQKRRKLLGLDLPIAILTFFLVLVTAGLILVAGLLGHKVIQLEMSIPSFTLPHINSNTSTPNQEQSPQPQPQPITASLTETIQVSIPGWSYFGCYYDNSERVFADYAGYDKENLTNQICADKCADRIYQYFGTTTGRRCFCGSTAEKLKRAPDWGCSAQCPGQKNVFEACGGPSFHLSVWKRD